MKIEIIKDNGRDMVEATKGGRKYSFPADELEDRRRRLSDMQLPTTDIDRAIQIFRNQQALEQGPA